MQLNRQMLIVIFVAVLFVGIGQSSGELVPVNIAYTADNVTAAVAKDGAAPVFYQPGTNAVTWQYADTMSLTLESGHTYQLIFRVNNDTTAAVPGHADQRGTLYPPGDGNPAGFLAEISGDNVNGPKLSSSDWEYALDDGSVAYGVYGSVVYDFNALTWQAATEWAWQGTDATNGGNNIWGNNFGPRTIAGISSEAKWIWGPNNGAALDAPNAAENFLWMRAIVTVIPEPSTLVMLLGLVGMLSLGYVRRKLYK